MILTPGTIVTWHGSRPPYRRQTGTVTGPDDKKNTHTKVKSSEGKHASIRTQNLTVIEKPVNHPPHEQS